MKIAISVSEAGKAKGKERAYVAALLAAGARPEEIEVITEVDASRVRTEDFDGILFAGGDDVDPAFYDEPKKYDTVHTNRSRDEFEFALLDRARTERRPVLGICRGIQMINVKFGGTLYQHLPSESDSEIRHAQEGSRSEPTHGVTLTDPESRLAEVFHGSWLVNSLHRQGIKRVGRGLKVTAYSEDGLVEAVEVADIGPYLLAVQWHPEEMTSRPEQLRLLAQFLDRCREHAGQR